MNDVEGLRTVADARVKVHRGRYVAVPRAVDLAGNVRAPRVAFRVTR